MSARESVHLYQKRLTAGTASLRVALVGTLAIASAMELRGGGEWPEFRGGAKQGVSDELGVPIEWSAAKNIAWQTQLPGNGWSSPVYADGRIYLTSAIPIPDLDPGDQKLVVLSVDATDGTLLWQTAVFENLREASPHIHAKNSHASPTPVVDGGQLFVHFGSQGTACLSLEGDLVWSTRELQYDSQHGSGGSPVVTDGVLIVNCDGADVQFVAGLDRATGKIRWRTDRPPLETGRGFSFCTPLVIDVKGQRQVVSPGTDQVVAYAPGDGNELWRFRYRGYSVVPRPVFGHGVLFISSGFTNPVLYALRPGANSAPPEVVWKHAKSAPHTPSLLLVGNELYSVSDRGVATCLDASTGKVHWLERLGGNYSASPVFAGGYIYFQNEDGGTVVIRAGAEYEEVQRNSLPGRTLASLAIADASIFLRTDTHLYRIQQK